MSWRTRVVIVAAAWCTPAAAQRPLAMDTLSLYELPGVLVVINAIPDEAVTDGFDADSIVRLIETKLEYAQIPVFTQPQWQTTLGSPMLFVDVDLFRASAFLYLYAIEVELRQLSVTMRDSSPVFAPTWHSGASLGSVATNRIMSIVPLILDAVDRFIGAHAAANRRRRPFGWGEPRRRFPFDP